MSLTICVLPSYHLFAFRSWHQHFDNVINLLLVGKKKWKVCSPHYDIDDDRFDEMVITIVQEEGDVVFLPHGWWHEVHTLEGKTYERKVYREKRSSNDCHLPWSHMLVTKYCLSRLR